MALRARGARQSCSFRRRSLGDGKRLIDLKQKTNGAQLLPLTKPLTRWGNGFMSNGSRPPMEVSTLWLQGMLLTFVVGFAILGYRALRVHSEHAPVPGRVVDETGRLLMTREAILQGQEAFLTHGLMQFGSVYGHGAYLGPDFTANY